MNPKHILSPDKIVFYKINEKKKPDGYCLCAFLHSVLIIPDTLILQNLDEAHSLGPTSQYSYFC